MIVAAEFMARMIQKYGKKVLEKIEESNTQEVDISVADEQTE